MLHPDVPGTGDTDAFVAVKQAYDVIGNAHARAAYDRSARRAVLEEKEAEVIRPIRETHIPAAPIRFPRPSDLPVAVWVVLGSVLIIGITQVVRNLMVLPPVPRRQEIRANAPTITPVAPEAAYVAAYGPTPVRLAGTPNYYVVPAAGATVLWRPDEAQNNFFPSGQLPPFSSVQALRLLQQNGLVEVRISDRATGFIEAARLAPGDATAARGAYCAYNAGPPPGNGEVFRQVGTGPGRLELDNRTTQPAVVKLRDRAGLAVTSVYLAPSSHVEVDGLPAAFYRPEFAIGELWSRACQGFAAGMRAQRLSGYFSLDELTPLTIPPDLPGEPPPADISDQAFERD